MTVPILIMSADDGTSLWREMTGDVQPCRWCKTGTWWFWYRRTEPSPVLVPIGFFCASLCASRHQKRPLRA